MSQPRHEMDLNFFLRHTQVFSADPDISSMLAKVERRLGELDWIEYDKAQATCTEHSGFKRSQEVINFLKQYHSLKTITVPTTSRPRPDKRVPPENVFCTFDSSVGGVTGKDVLVQRAVVISALMSLTNCLSVDRPSVDTLLTLTLPAEGIIKFPKRSPVLRRMMDTEVQAEYIALEMAYVLGFKNLCRPSMIYHKVENVSRPALFVPFDRIRLLGDYAHIDTELEQSVIRPTGEGVVADSSIEDLGPYLAYLFLCGDPDAIGKEGQNKGIINGRSLYIFDQVIKDNPFFVLDSNLNLCSSKLIYASSRHLKGRNKCLMEDASIVSKFNGFMHVLDREGDIHLMFAKIQSDYADALMKLNKASPRPKVAIEQVEALRTAASRHHAVIVERLEQIKLALPVYVDESADSSIRPPYAGRKDVRNVVSQLLLFQQAFAERILYGPDGQVYRAPRPTCNPSKIISVTEKDDGVLVVECDSDIPAEALAQFEKVLGVELTPDDTNSYVISKDKLSLVSECLLCAEYGDSLELDYNYVDIAYLKRLQERYHYKAEDYKVLSRNIMSIMKAYKHDIDTDNTLLSIDVALHNVESLVKAAKKKGMPCGYYLHVFRCLLYDVTRQLCLLDCIREKPGLQEKILKAFQAAKKLDCLKTFNHVIIAAIRGNALSDGRFLDYLEELIAKGGRRESYSDTETYSQEMIAKGDALCAEINPHQVSVGVRALVTNFIKDYYGVGEVSIPLDVIKDAGEEDSAVIAVEQDDIDLGVKAGSDPLDSTDLDGSGDVSGMGRSRP